VLVKTPYRRQQAQSSNAVLYAIMPGIEVLPNSTSIKSPGWALVPDTRGGAAQVVAQPTGGRKRAARNVGLASGDTTARQQNAVIKHLADLDRDSHRDIQIPVPKDGAGRGWASREASFCRCDMAKFEYRVEEDHP